MLWYILKTKQSVGARPIRGVEAPRKDETTEEQGGWRWRAQEQPDMQAIGHILETGSAGAITLTISGAAHTGNRAKPIEFSCIVLAFWSE